MQIFVAKFYSLEVSHKIKDELSYNECVDIQARIEAINKRGVDNIKNVIATSERKLQEGFAQQLTEDATFKKCMHYLTVSYKYDRFEVDAVDFNLAYWESLSRPMRFDVSKVLSCI